MPVSMKRYMAGRISNGEWIRHAASLISKADGQGGIADAYLALFMETMALGDDEHTSIRDLKRELGIPVDETVYLVAVSDVTKTDEPIKHLSADVVVGLEAARQKLYHHYNKLYSLHDQDCEPAEQFVQKLEPIGAALAEIGDSSIHFSLQKVTSVAGDVEPFQPPVKKPPGKKPKPVDEEDELDDEDEGEVEQWPEDEDDEEDDDDEIDDEP